MINRTGGISIRYPNIRPGTFVSRPNRFIALVELDGELEACHVKNTGRCRELLVPGCTVYLCASDNPARKTRYDLVAVLKGSLLINMDSAAPNAVFGEWVKEGGFLPDITLIRPEYTYGGSRFDFYLEQKGSPVLVEVKGVTLEEDGLALFPDAPTERGIKHLKGLSAAANAGIEAWVCFVIQMSGMRYFAPNNKTHPAFGEELRKARDNGVHLLAVGCAVTPESLRITVPIPILLP